MYLNTNTKGVIGMQRVQENPDYTAWAQPVFPGIALIHLSAHGKAACLEEAAPVSADVLEIFHCREGRMELNIAKCFFLASASYLLKLARYSGNKDMLGMDPKLRSRLFVWQCAASQR